ncbi:MAG: hypothetical protein ACREQP_08805 [Candidatus Binatia bacterium]
MIFSTCLAITAAVCAARGGASESGSGRLIGSCEITGPLLFYLALSLGVLTKGLIALLLSVVALGAFSILKRKIGKAIFDRLLANRYALAGALLFLLLVTPWHLLAARDNPDFVRYYLLDNQFLRYVKGGTLIEDDVSVTTSMFLVLVFVWFLPWSTLLPAVLRGGVPQRKGAVFPDDDMKLLPVIWAAVILLFPR